MVDGGIAVSRPKIQTALDQISGAPLKYLINTHWHWDHTDGNEWLQAQGADPHRSGKHAQTAFRFDARRRLGLHVSARATNALRASKLLGLIIVIFSFGLGGAALIGIEFDSFIFPLGLVLFAAVISIRIWARSKVSANRDFNLPPESRIGEDTRDKGVRNVAQIF